jgi:hypothetical protein
MKIAHEFDLDYILISFSATGDGKGIPDGSSGDGASQFEICNTESKPMLTMHSKFLCIFQIKWASLLSHSILCIGE